MGTTPLIGAFKNICYCKSSYPEISADNSVVLKNSSRALLLCVAYVDVSIQPGIKHYHHRHTCLWLECILLPEGAANARTKNTLSNPRLPMMCTAKTELKVTTKEALSFTTRNTLATCTSAPRGLKGPSFWLKVFLSAVNRRHRCLSSLQQDRRHRYSRTNRVACRAFPLRVIRHPERANLAQRRIGRAQTTEGDGSCRWTYSNSHGTPSQVRSYLPTGNF